MHIHRHLKPSGLAIAVAVVFTLVVGVFPGWLIDASNTVTTYAR